MLIANLSVNQTLHFCSALFHIFALRDTDLDGLIDSGNFSMRGYLPLIGKDSRTHMYSLEVYVKEGLLLHGTYMKKPLHVLIYVFDWLCLTHCLTSFSSINHLLRLCAQFLILFHLTQMKFSSSTYLLMFLSLETSTSIIRTGLLIL